MAKKPELLIPAGSLDILKTAVNFGADAVYIGGEAFSLRAKAKNFSIDDIKAAIDFAHKYKVKVYVTANIFAHNNDLSEAKKYFTELNEIKPDALIIADPGMLYLANTTCPDIPIHISTQANNTNYLSYHFWYNQGIRRVVAARELSLSEISEIRKNIPSDMEIESFVHGAMCISYSGRCLLSNFFTGRDANLGACTHPCRWKYAVVEEQRPGEYLPVYENSRGTYIYNSRDLCMIEHIPELVSAGINSFKIEGRMKAALYVASVTRTYRKAIDDFFISEQLYRNNLDWYRTEITRLTYRHFSTGFYFGKANESNQIYDASTYRNESVFLGIIDLVDPGRGVRIKQKNKFTVGDCIEIMKPTGENIPVTIERITDENAVQVPDAPHAGQILYLKLTENKNPAPPSLDETGPILSFKAAARNLPAPGDILRKNLDPKSEGNV